MRPNRRNQGSQNNILVKSSILLSIVWIQFTGSSEQVFDHFGIFGSFRHKNNFGINKFP